MLIKYYVYYRYFFEDEMMCGVLLEDKMAEFIVFDKPIIEEQDLRDFEKVILKRVQDEYPNKKIESVQILSYSMLQSVQILSYSMLQVGKDIGG